MKKVLIGKEFRFVRSWIRAGTGTRVRVYTRLRSRACAREVGKFLQHILDGLHQFCAVFDELMTADREWVLDTPRDAEHLASLLARHARRRSEERRVGKECRSRWS